jgi:hypothetical protein
MMSKRVPGSRSLATFFVGATTLLAWWSPEGSASFAANASPAPPVAATCGVDAALRNFFKGPPGGVKVKEKVELYDEKGLFNYIDGGAPLYIKHHFRRLGAAEMATSDGGELTCDIYDMNGAANSAAVFGEEKSSAFKLVAKWPDAASGPMAFIFHQGCYYVKLTAFDKKAEGALSALAAALRERMTGVPPASTSK